MASSKTQVAKEKGNAAFKARDYPTAVGHYTSAIVADRNEPTFPLNRAAAYLKLGKYEDAMRDCSTVLALDPSNVKALFRRGQAKMGMDKLSEAQNDYKEALRLEPANDSIKLEIKAVEKLLKQHKQHDKFDCAAQPSRKPDTSSDQAPPKRRRIPLNIVEPPPTRNKPIAAVVPNAPIPEDTDLLKPVSSRPLKAASEASSTGVTATSVPFPPAATFKDTKEAHESSRPSRTGGGIFRQYGNRTIFGARDGSGAVPSPPLSVPEPTPHVKTKTATNGSSSTKPPMTLFNFTRAWESLSSAKQRWSLVSSIPPSSLPAMFQMSLEPSLLVSILETFRTILDQSQADADAKCQVGDYMEALANIPRFNTVWLFLGRPEKECAKDVWNMLAVENPGAAWSL